MLFQKCKQNTYSWCKNSQVETIFTSHHSFGAEFLYLFIHFSFVFMIQFFCRGFRHDFDVFLSEADTSLRTDTAKEAKEVRAVGAIKTVVAIVDSTCRVIR